MLAVSPSIVRKATVEDHQEIWRLFLMAHNENGMFKLAPERVEFFLQRALRPELIHPADTGPRGQVVVIGPPGKLEAICFVILGNFWYSNEFHLEELLVYVDPECRNSHHARSLIEWMKKTADALGIKVLTGVISNTRTKAKVRLYERMKLPCVGAFFLYPNDSSGGELEGRSGQQGQRKV